MAEQLTRRIIVTGGSRGIGRALVLELARQGHQVLFTYKGNVAAAESLQQEAPAGRVLGVQADSTRLEDIRSLFDRAARHWGQAADALISNAFPTSIFAPTALMSEADFDSMFAGVRGHYFLLQEAAQKLADGGSIVVVSSGAASMPGPASGAYSGAKSAVEKFALALSKEVGVRQIKVNVVAPGVTQTEGLVAPRPMIDALIAQTPLGRLGQPEDVAKVIAWLVSPEAAWVNSQVIGANGGIL